MLSSWQSALTITVSTCYVSTDLVCELRWDYWGKEGSVLNIHVGLLSDHWCDNDSYSLLGTLSNLEMLKDKENVHRLYENFTLFYINSLNIHIRFWRYRWHLSTFSWKQAKIPRFIKRWCYPDCLAAPSTWLGSKSTQAWCSSITCE